MILDHFDYSRDYEHIPFTEPSTWQPAWTDLSQPIRDLMQGDEKRFLTFRISGEGQSNVTPQHRTAIKELSRNPEVIIKPADKGGQIILQDKSNYLREAHRQLSDTNYYIPLAESMQLATQVLVRKSISRLYDKGFINQKQRNYLFGPDDPRPRQFYLLPKIHKSPDTWTLPHIIPKGRPIVSDCGSESYRIAEFIDYHINPLSTKHPSYIKDTYAFVNLLTDKCVPASTLLFSIDVDSLYTNIDTSLGLQALRKAFVSYPEANRPDSEIIHLLEMTLTRNDFEFYDKFYLQTCGCAMGRKYSPSYADIYLANWEEEALKRCVHRPLLYLRYLDDLFGLWTESKESFLEFVKVLNSQHPRIKLKHNLQTQEVEFLDTVVFFTEIDHTTATKKLATKVYFKETDRHALLHKHSFHPKHTFKGLIKAQLIRFHRICTYPQHVEEATAILFSALLPRGYSHRFLRTIKAQVNGLFKSQQYHNERRDDQTPIIPLVLTYSSSGMIFKKTIAQNFQKASLDCPQLGSFRLITALRRNKNLQDLLVHTALKRDTGRKSRTTLNFNFKHKVFLYNRHTKKGKPITKRITVNTKNVVYGLVCQECHKIYIGETKNVLKDRIKQHLYHIRKGDLPVTLYMHFNRQQCKEFFFLGLDTQPTWSDAQRKRAEATWIKEILTMEPMGLNYKTYNRYPGSLAPSSGEHSPLQTQNV